MTTSPAPAALEGSSSGEVDPVIRQAQARGLVSFNTTRLVDAAEVLVKACMDADAREELDMEIDGSMMDEVRDAIADLRGAQSLQPSSAADAKPVAWLTGDMLQDILSSFKDRADVAEIAAKINAAIAQPQPSQQGGTQVIEADAKRLAALISEGDVRYVNENDVPTSDEDNRSWSEFIARHILAALKTSEAG